MSTENVALIKKILTANDYKDTELAEMLGISSNYIWNIRNNKASRIGKTLEILIKLKFNTETDFKPAKDFSNEDYMRIKEELKNAQLTIKSLQRTLDLQDKELERLNKLI